MAVRIHHTVHAMENVLNYELSVTQQGFGKRKMQIFYKEAFSSIEDNFGRYVDTQAMAMPGTLHHVYEWNQIGKKRLWQLIKVGSGDSGFNITAGFWKSKVKAPIDPILKVPGKNGRIVTKSRVFYNKAEVMESGVAVTMRARGKSRMAYPTSRTKSGIGFTHGPLRVEHPGGKGTTFGFQKTMFRYFGTGLATRHLKASGVMDRPAKRVSKAAKAIPQEITKVGFKGSMGRAAIDAAAARALERA